ncbi:MAG TPA: flagellar basal body P-ring formation chaperone FlgA [Candidatus Deferrimicrobium sp.]|nr:flagellar basal body P-ring formation chaperone FlgA [Candidatus Deferrimicrobium sp.]
MKNFVLLLFLFCFLAIPLTVPLTGTGAPAVTITGNMLTVSPTFFKDMILAYIVKNSQWKDGISVEVTSAKDILIPQADENNIRWQLTPANGQDFFGNILFKLQAFSKTSNEEIYANWLVAKLKITKSVPISNRTIQKNELIDDADIRWEVREIDAFTKDAIIDKNDLLGAKAVRIIRPNSVITTGLLEKKYLVQRGSTALLVAQLNNIKATSTVKVLSDGGYGDTVQVINISSQKILSAVVTGKNQLEVTVQ